MKQVLSEFLFPNSRFQIAMRGDDDPRANRNRFVPANPFDFSLFEYSQKLGLHVQRHVADFVQKYRSLVCLLKFSDVAT
jgi:hypothetical protein